MTKDTFFKYILDKKKRKSTVIFAHRGVSSLEKDNNIKAIQRGISMNNLDGIEIDVQRTKDNFLIVKHDFTLDKIRGNPYIKDLALQEIRQFCDAADCPLLEDILILFKNTTKILDIEIKSPGIIKEVIQLCKKHGIYDNVVFTSIYESINNEIKNTDSEVARIFGYPRDRGKNLALQWWTQPFVKIIVWYIKIIVPTKINNIMSIADTQFISLYEKVITPAVVENIHKCNGYCIGATINIQNDQNEKYALSAITTMQKMGVDVIKTDHPQLVC